MPLFIGHRTAESILNLQVADNLSTDGEVSLDYCFVTKEKLSQLDLGQLAQIEQPYDVLVSQQGEYRSWKGVRCHKCTTDLPSGAFFELTPDVMVATPELCLVLRARELSLPQTIALGIRFCGTYALDKSAPGGIRQRDPLTTVERLTDFAHGCSRIWGAKKAREAVRWILPNSASPMETLCCIPFYLPQRYGGFGFARPQLNYEILLSEAAARLSMTRRIRVDIFWKDADFGLEYQGKANHSSDSDIARDVARQLAAERMKKSLQMVTIEQIRDQDQRMAIAEKVAWHLGEKLPHSRGFMQANQRLVNDLLSMIPKKKSSQADSHTERAGR